MSPFPAPATNVVPFRRPPSPFPSRAEQGGFLDAVYAAQALGVPAEDIAAKRLAARFTILGFLAIDEILPDGRLRRLRPSEIIGAAPERAWRVSRRSAERADSRPQAG